MLETRETIAIRADDAKHLTTDVAVGILALTVTQVVDALDAALREVTLNLVGLVRVHLHLDVGEGRVLRKRREVRGGLPTKISGENPSGCSLVRDLVGVAVDRRAVDAHGEHVAVTVIDGATLCLDGDDVEALQGRLALKVRDIEDLQPKQAGTDEGSDGDDSDGKGVQAGIEARRVEGRRATLIPMPTRSPSEKDPSHPRPAGA